MHAAAPCLRREGERQLFADAVRNGLGSTPKRLASKWFYDAEGSQLFEQICAQPEYYLTTAELALMRMHAPAIAAAIGAGARVVEYGCGAGVKTELLLRHLDAPAAYVPVEISPAALAAAGDRLRLLFPSLPLLPVCADFTAPHALPPAPGPTRRTVIYFPGSTLGNFDEPAAHALLGQIRREMGPGGAALIGIDLVKEIARLEAAYNDAAGVTARFTLNLLARINRELDGDFEIDRFAHRARYDSVRERIETHIVSLHTQRVRVGGQRFDFAAGEAMAVEVSHKYRLDRFALQARKAGLGLRAHWCDPAGDFALVLLEAIRA